MWDAIIFVAGWFWRWEVVSTGAVAVFIAGGISAIYGDDFILATCLFFAAIVWITAKAVSWSEVRGHKDRIWVSIVIVVLAVLCLWGSMKWIQQRAELVARKTQAPEQIANPPAGNASPPPQQSNNEPNHGPPPQQHSETPAPKGATKGQPQAPAKAEIRGSDNTLVGNVGNRPVQGNGNTVVGATDAQGNTIITHPGTAIGNGAQAGPSGIAIGAHAGASGSIIQSNSGGSVNVQQGTTGSNSPIIDSPITVGKAPKAISAAEMKEVTSFLQMSQYKPKINVVADVYSSAAPFPADFLKALHDAGWQTLGDTVDTHPPRDTLPYFRGARLYLYDPPNESQTVRGNDPAAYVLKALYALKVPATVEFVQSSPGATTPADGVIIVVFLNGFD
jgi:hypothetical protein